MCNGGSLGGPSCVKATRARHDYTSWCTSMCVTLDNKSRVLRTVGAEGPNDKKHSDPNRHGDRRVRATDGPGANKDGAGKKGSGRTEREGGGCNTHMLCTICVPGSDVRCLRPTGGQRTPDNEILYIWPKWAMPAA